MKINPVILFLFVFLLGCGNAEYKPDLSSTAPEKDPMESAVEWSKLQNRNGDAYIPNTDKPYSGWARENYDNGQVKVLAEFTDGSVTRLRQWQENGIPMWDIRYSKGKVSLSDLPLKDYFLSDHSLQHGLCTLWYENGQKEEEGNFKEGELDGLATVWYENGQKKKEGNFKGGKQDEITTYWYENGQKSGEDIYKEGRLLSSISWKPNGEKCTLTNVKNGNGVMVYYYENGQIEQTCNWKDGKLHGLCTNWHENGQKEIETNFRDGKQHGLHIYYKEDGTEDFRKTFKDGELVED